MSPWSLLGFGRSLLFPAKSAELAARYRRLRAAAFNLGNELASSLRPDVLDEGAKKLGLLRRGKLIVHTEEELPVLMDYCIYNVFRQGRNALDRYLASPPEEPGDDEVVCLQAMQRATYTVVMVETLQPGLGAMVRDLRSGETTLLVDMALSATAVPDLILATRLLPVDDWVMTGGAALPVGLFPDDDGPELLQELAQSLAPDEQGYFDPAALIRDCLEAGSSEMIAYAEAAPSGRNARPPKPKPALLTNPSALSPAERRNAPCPCGSGKKLKHCCLRKMGRRAK